MHLITLMDWEAERIRELLSLAHKLKEQARQGTLQPTLTRKTLALLFEKSSMRTRVSFEVAMTQLGGHVTYLSKDDVNLGVREPIRDGARVLARYADGVAARTYSHGTVEELAAHSAIPVINALSDKAHPCQALADILTIQERLAAPEKARTAFIGDANNVARSLATICAKLGLSFTIASPPGYAFDAEFSSELQAAASASGASISATSSPAEAAAGADVLYTDVWVSMGQEAEAETRRAAFAGFCIDSGLLAQAADSAVVMHDMPAHRGEEITDAVIEGPQSVVFDQAENRLHAQRAVLQMLLGPQGA
ncbi:MAG: ornithine carbamoyltransferase [Planctomycetota bacterium]|jgi:ornithine carbamoyltransferase